jgi:hypothetical protein
MRARLTGHALHLVVQCPQLVFGPLSAVNGGVTFFPYLHGCRPLRDLLVAQRVYRGTGVPR